MLAANERIPSVQNKKLANKNDNQVPHTHTYSEWKGESVENRSAQTTKTVHNKCQQQKHKQRGHA